MCCSLLVVTTVMAVLCASCMPGEETGGTAKKTVGDSAAAEREKE
jgi:hypothetical protein